MEKTSCLLPLLKPYLAAFLESSISYIAADRLETDGLAGADIFLGVLVVFHETGVAHQHGGFILTATPQVLQKGKNGIKLFLRHLVDGVMNSVSCLHCSHDISPFLKT